MNTELQPKRSLPILGWIGRYWWLLLVCGLLIALWQVDAIFTEFRGVLTAPMFCFLAFGVALLIRNLFYRSTIDADAGSGRFTQEWQELDGKTRLTLTVIMTSVIILAVSIITAAAIN